MGELGQGFVDLFQVVYDFGHAPLACGGFLVKQRRRQVLQKLLKPPSNFNDPHVPLVSDFLNKTPIMFFFLAPPLVSSVEGITFRRWEFTNNREKIPAFSQ